MMRADRLLPAMVLATFLLAAIGILAEPAGPLRPVLTLPFLLTGPGLAWAGRLGDWHPVPLAAIAIALSLALAILVAALLLLLDLWSPRAGFMLLGLCALAPYLLPWPKKRAPVAEAEG
jgi:hypothetical protein